MSSLGKARKAKKNPAPSVKEAAAPAAEEAASPQVDAILEPNRPRLRHENIAKAATDEEMNIASLGLPRIHSMGRSIFDPIWAIKDHASRGAELMYILRGQVKVHTPDYVLPAGEGDLVYTPNQLMHRDEFPLQSEFEVYLVQFHWEGEKELFSKLTPAQLTAASREDAAAFAADMRQLYADFLQPGPLTAQLTSQRLLQIIMRLWHHAIKAQQPGSPVNYDLAKARRVQIMTEARHLINERFSQPLGLDDIAETIDVSPYYLSRVFSQEAGFTLSNYLHDVRMEKAASLLRSPRTAVSDIARQVGFRDAHYFARVFKNHFGLAPSAYRASVLPDK